MSARLTPSLCVSSTLCVVPFAATMRKSISSTLHSHLQPLRSLIHDYAGA